MDGKIKICIPLFGFSMVEYKISLCLKILAQMNKMIRIVNVLLLLSLITRP